MGLSTLNRAPAATDSADHPHHANEFRRQNASEFMNAQRSLVSCKPTLGYNARRSNLVLWCALKAGRSCPGLALHLLADAEWPFWKETLCTRLLARFGRAG